MKKDRLSIRRFLLEDSTQPVARVFVIYARTDEEALKKIRGVGIPPYLVWPEDPEKP